MNKIKLSFSDKKNYKWIVNGNATVCMIECYVSFNEDFYNLYEHKLKRLFPKVRFYAYCDRLYFTVTGVAKRNTLDVSDEILGRHLAEARAKSKAYSIANRFINTYLDFIYADLNNIEQFSKETNYQRTHEKQHINWLLNGED